MSTERVQLNYDTLQQKWTIQVNKPSLHDIRERVIKVYWGANKTPLSLYIRFNTKEETREKVSCHALLDKQGKNLYIHPLIGILTSSKSGQPFGGRISNFIDIIRAAHAKGAIVFVFTPKHVNWQAEKIKGYLYHPASKQWKACLFPFPNVVYNRIPTRDQERTPQAVECIRKLMAVPNLTLFNPHFFNKFELYQLLKQDHVLKQYLPETIALKSANDLEHMLAKHKIVYLKPTKGKAGAGIMRVIQSTNNQFLLFVQGKSTMRRIVCTSVAELLRKVKEYGMASPYIIQQGIRLAKINRCPFDFRVLVQKNGQGEWEVAGLGMRVAGVNRITTHVPRGGRIERPAKVLQQLFTKQEASQIKHEVEQLSISIAKRLEQHYIHLGEMSMDIGLDSRGNLWFFEANSKPMKFDEPDIRRRSLNNLIYYAQFLTLPQSQERRQVHVHH